MKLYFLRHGEAGHAGADYPDDRQRPLTADGRKEMRAIAEGMRVLGLKFDVILSSPLVRTMETAEAVGKAYSQPVETFPALASGTRLLEIVKAIEGIDPAHEHVLLVGHEPEMSRLVSWFIHTEAGPVGIHFRKAALAKVKCSYSASRGGGALEWFLTPGQLARLGS